MGFFVYLTAKEGMLLRLKRNDTNLWSLVGPNGSQSGQTTRRSTSKLISGGTPSRTGAPTVPKPRFT